MNSHAQVLGPYRLMRKLGEGATGAVFLAEHAELGARYAVKLLTGLEDETLVARFQREGEALASVDDHPNVVRVHTLGRDRIGRPYLVMDLLAGGDLDARLEGGPLEPTAAAALVRDLAGGLAHVHARGVLHRDLKPQNVLFCEDGTPKLADFGLAGIAGSEALTQTGHIVGTPAYMAPEQAIGLRGAVDERTDVYGLGAVLYHCLTGRSPFDGTSVLLVLDQVVHQAPPAIGGLAPEVPAPLVRICQKAMAKAPYARYASAAALRADLERFLAGELVEARPPRGRLWAFGLVAVLAVGLFVGVLMNSSSPAAPAPVKAAAPPPSLTPPQQGPSPQDLARGDLELKKAAQVSDPWRRSWALQSWLEAYPEHPRRSRAQALIDELCEARLCELRQARAGYVRAIALADGRVISFGEDATLWELREEAPARVRSYPLGHVGAVAPWPGGFLAVLREGAQRVELEAGVQERLLDLRLGAYVGTAWRSDGVVAVSDSPPRLSPDLPLPEGEHYPRVHILGLAQPVSIELRDWGWGQVRAMAFYGEDRLLLAGYARRKDDANRVEVFSVASGARLSQATVGEELTVLDVAPGGRFAVAGNVRGQLLRCDQLEGPRACSEWPAVLGDPALEVFESWKQAHDGDSHAVGVVFLPGERLASVSTGSREEINELKVWSLSKASLLRRGTVPRGAESLALTPDGRFLLVGTRAGAVEVWLAGEGSTPGEGTVRIGPAAGEPR